MPETGTELEKEQFESKMKDEELIEQIDAWEAEAQDVYSALKPVWKQNWEYYIGIQTGVNEIVGNRSKAVENRIFMAMETMIPIASSSLPETEVRAGSDDEEDQINADALKDTLAYQFERVRIQEQAEQFLRYMLLFRYGVFKVGWDATIDDVFLQTRDPRKIRIPKFGGHPDDLKFIIEDLEMSYDSIKEQFGEVKANKVLNERPQDAETKVRKKTFTVNEVWTNSFVVWRAGSIILESKSNPYWKEGSKNFFQNPKKPYIIKALFTTEETLISDTDYIQQHIPIQDNINKRKRQIEDISEKVANPPMLIDSDVMSEEQAGSITNEPGIILYGKDAASGKIRFEAPGQVPQYLFADLETSRQQFDNIWGIHSTTRGEREARETATGRQLLRQADLGRIDLVSRQLERALDEIAEYWTQLIKLFYDEEKSFSILGEDGTLFIQKFSRDKVGEDVKPMVRPGSTLPKDEVFLREEALLLWQYKALGVRTLYKRLKLPNMEDALQDYIQTQSGALFQQAGVQPPQ